MELAHALAIIQSLILISAANGAPLLVARPAGSAPCPSDRRGDRIARRSSSTRSFQDLAWARRSYSSRDLRGGPDRSAVAAGCARCGASAMAGDCLSSFVKRRFGLEPSSMTLGLDQVPESLFPAIVCSAYLPLGPVDVLTIVLVFSVGELAMSRLLFAVGLRDRPY